MDNPEVSNNNNLEPEEVKVDKVPYFSDEFVQNVRDNFLQTKLSNENATQNYDQIDIERLKSDDWFVRRFLVEKSSTNVEVAVKKLHNAMVWRREFGVNQLHDSMFPMELYKIGGMFVYLPDRQGNDVLIIRLRQDVLMRHSKLPYIPKILELRKKFVIHHVEKLFLSNPNRKASLVIDFQHVKLTDLDIRVGKFVLETMMNYYNASFSWGCLFEVPWLLNKVGTLAMMALLSQEDRKRIHLCTKENITELISIENLPDFMGGQGSKDYRAIPQEVTLELIPWAFEHGLIHTEEQAEFVKTVYDKLCTV